MKTNTSKNIVSYIEAKGWVRPVDLALHLGITTQALHRHLRTLTEQGVLVKKGQPPHTVYELALAKTTQNKVYEPSLHDDST